tara:strand:- start:279 stop:644 length:366 start_codon:yes stop_codon:yes gene_type:complete
MSKSMTNKDLKQLAKYIVTEQEEMKQIQTKKIQEKNKIKFNNLMTDELSKNNFIQELIDNVFEDYVNDFEDEVDMLFFLKLKVNDIEELLNDLEKERNKCRLNLTEKYKYIINNKLVNVGF